MPVQAEQHAAPRLTVTREPVGPSNTAEAQSLGDQAFRDALIAVCVAWALVFILWYSVRSYNV